MHCRFGPCMENGARQSAQQLDAIRQEIEEHFPVHPKGGSRLRHRGAAPEGLDTRERRDTHRPCRPGPPLQWSRPACAARAVPTAARKWPGTSLSWNSVSPAVNGASRTIDASAVRSASGRTMEDRHLLDNEQFVDRLQTVAQAGNRRTGDRTAHDGFPDRSAGPIEQHPEDALHQIHVL